MAGIVFWKLSLGSYEKFRECMRGAVVDKD